MLNTRFQYVVDDSVPERNGKRADNHDHANVGSTHHGNAAPKSSHLAFIVEGFALYGASLHTTDIYQIEHLGSRRAVGFPDPANWSAKAGALIMKLCSDWRRERKIARLISSLEQLDDAILRDVGIEHKSQIEWLIRHGRD
jgi:uncharacterized protein YjiS (DUF1127 family)